MTQSANGNLASPLHLTPSIGDQATLQDRGTYVEGFAIYRDGGDPVPHAWLTLDGINAVDVTWRQSPSECFYFGIPYQKFVLERFLRRTGTWGPLLEPGQQEIVMLDAGLLCPTS